MDGLGDVERTQQLVRAYVGPERRVDGEREEHLRQLLAATERMAWRTDGQPEGAAWQRLLTAILAELRAPS